MDTDDLSNESYEIIVKAEDITNFLKTDLGVLAEKCKNEKEYLENAFSFVEKIFQDQDGYLDEWMLEELLDEEKIVSLMNYIKSVQATPEKDKTYVDW